MSGFRYRPAAADGWLAVASAARLLVVHPQAVEAAVAVSEATNEDSVDGFQGALDELTRGGLSATPPFALLALSGGGESALRDNALRVIVRGGVKVTVTTDGTTCTVDGTGVSTWTEQNFAHATGFEVVVVPAPEQALGGDRWLPLTSGTVLVERIASVDPKLSGASSAPAAAEAAGNSGAPGNSGAAENSGPAGAAPTSTPPAPVTAPVETSVSEATVVDLPPALSQGADDQSTDAGYDYLFGETMHRNVSEAAVREREAEEESSQGTRAGDHDGMTIMTGDLRKLRGARKGAAPPAVHPAPTPDLYLELSTGSRESLTQPVLVGRAPTARKVSGGSMPRLVTIPGDKDISRNHAQFVVEGGTVVVTDLHSRNGTQVIMPGKSPQQLRRGEPTAVIVGTVIDLGGGVTLTVREEG